MNQIDKFHTEFQVDSNIYKVNRDKKKLFIYKNMDDTEVTFKFYFEMIFFEKDFPNYRSVRVFEQ